MSNSCKAVPLAGREVTVMELQLLITPPLVHTLMKYCVLHWRLDKVALVAVALSTVYITRGCLSGR